MELNATTSDNSNNLTGDSLLIKNKDMAVNMNSEWFQTTKGTFNSTTAEILKSIQACTSTINSFEDMNNRQQQEDRRTTLYNNSKQQPSYFAYNGVTDS